MCAWLLEEQIAQQSTGETFDLMIVTPTRDGRVSSKWHAAEKQLRNPLKTAEALESGQPVDMSRNIGVSKALQMKCKYILFFDADVLPPADGLEKLLSLRMPVVGGLYRSRGPPFQLLANKDDKPIPDDVLNTPNALIEVDEVGAGFLLVDIRAIKRYAMKINHWQCLANHKDRGAPVFIVDDKTALSFNYRCQYCQGTLVANFFDYRAGKRSTLAISEDYYFNRKMKELCGFKTYVFTGVFCVHENNFGEVGREPVLVTSLQSAANVK
jgi:glycosyltransferase involved in cell wall biosynthesis